MQHKNFNETLLSKWLLATARPDVSICISLSALKPSRFSLNTLLLPIDEYINREWSDSEINSYRKSISFLMKGETIVARAFYFNARWTSCSTVCSNIFVLSFSSSSLLFVAEEICVCWWEHVMILWEVKESVSRILNLLWKTCFTRTLDRCFRSYI